MRIIVRSPNWIGDQILAYPFFWHLRRAYPKAYIAVACVPWVQALQFRQQVNEVILLDRPAAAGKTFLTQLQILNHNSAQVRQAGPWDLAICLPNSFSAAFVFYHAGVRRIRGYSADGRRLLLKEALSWETGKQLHRSDAYTRLILEGEYPGVDFWDHPPEDPLDPPVRRVLESFDARAEWDLSGAALEPPAGAYWVLAPGTTAESRQWPLESYASLALQIAKTGMQGVVVGGQKETVQAEALIRLVGGAVEDWTNRAPVGALWKLFQQARFTVSNDSGLAHVASICGSPVHIVWGGGNPLQTRPIGPGQVRMVFNAVPCWPCEKNFCAEPQGTQFQCLTGVRPEEVWKEIVDAKYV